MIDLLKYFENLYTSIITTSGNTIGLITIAIAVVGFLVWAYKKVFKKSTQEQVSELTGKFDELAKELREGILNKRVDPQLEYTAQLPTQKPEPSDHARELAKQIPEDADPYSRAVKAIASKDLDKARALLVEVEQNKVEELIKVYETRCLIEYYDGNYAKAAELVLEILRIVPDDIHWLNVATILLNYSGKYKIAIPLAEKALDISKNKFGLEHEAVASSMNNLASLLKHEKDYDKAEDLFKIALDIRLKILGEHNPDVAVSYSNLADLYRIKGFYGRSEELNKHALDIKEKILKVDDPSIAVSLINLATVYFSQGDYDKARPLFERALRIKERNFGKEHFEVAAVLNNLAELHSIKGLYDNAELFYIRAIKILEANAPNNPNLVSGIVNYASMLEVTGRDEEAKIQYQKAEAIKAKQSQNK